MRRLTAHRLMIVAAAAAVLSACGEKPKPAEGSASGEVLQGTISDDMLPLEQLQSSAPLADPTSTATGDASSAPDAADAPAEDAAPTPEASEAPSGE